MQFDFETFAKLAERAYNEDVPSMDGFTLAEALDVFRRYFQEYERCRGEPHPPIRLEQIRAIMEEMPGVMDGHDRYIDLDPEDYPAMIERHFHTRYRHCDYNINHFFSGRVREMRYYETCY